MLVYVCFADVFCLLLYGLVLIETIALELHISISMAANEHSLKENFLFVCAKHRIFVYLLSIIHLFHSIRRVFLLEKIKMKDSVTVAFVFILVGVASA